LQINLLCVNNGLMNLKTFIGTFDSQLSAAKKIGVAPSSVNHWVTGRRKPSIDTAKRMVKLSKGKLSLESIYRE